MLLVVVVVVAVADLPLLVVAIVGWEERQYVSKHIPVWEIDRFSGRHVT